jgi:hypothetical protein
MTLHSLMLVGDGLDSLDAGRFWMKSHDATHASPSRTGPETLLLGSKELELAESREGRVSRKELTDTATCFGTLPSWPSPWALG